MFETLGKKVSKFQGFETFPAPRYCQTVTMESDEVTAVCPVTGQPDWYTVVITYNPDTLCLESKCLKLYLQSFRNDGIFCEALADKIALDIGKAIRPQQISVTIHQKARGGIAIVTESVMNEADIG